MMKPVPLSRQRPRQRGAALIMALLIASLATALAASLIVQENTWLRGLETRRDLMQARQLARAGVDWARAILAEDARTSRYDHRGEPWATLVPAMPAEGGEIGGQLIDEQGKLNLNNLVRNGQPSEEDRQTYQNLLSLLQLPPELAASLMDWLDADNTPQTGGAEDSDYLAETPPYRAAQRELTDIDNLRHVRGYTPAIIERLRPYVTVLPGYNLLNINTASTLVISAVLHGFTAAEIRQIVVDRDRIPYLDAQDFLKRLPRQDLAKLPSVERIGTRSHYFSAFIHARIGRADTRIQALLLRATNWPQIVWQKLE